MTNYTRKSTAIFDRIGSGYDRTRRADPTLASEITKSRCRLSAHTTRLSDRL